MKHKGIAALLLTAAVGFGAFSLQPAPGLPGMDQEAPVISAQAASAPSASTLAKAIKKAFGDDYWADYKLGKQDIKDRYGVSSSWYSSAYAEIPMMSGHVDQLVIFKAKNSSSKKKILSAIKAYQKQLKEDTLQYPMNQLKIQGSKVYSNGKYVCFFMLGQVSKSTEENGTEEEIIKAYKAQNNKAANIVKKKLK